MKLVVPDLISPSYFPAIAAVDLGCFADEGLDVEASLHFPLQACYAQLRAGEVDFVAASLHSAVSAFPEWDGAKALAALGQGMYWFLVMRSDIGAVRNDLACVKGRTIGAAGWVDLGLRGVLRAAGIDPERDDVRIVPPVAPSGNAGTNFGLAAARALAERRIDGFWANGMAAEIAERSGAGTVVLDVRRGDGPPECFDFTAAALVTSGALIARDPAAARGAVRAIVAAHRRLRADPSLAAEVGRKRFPPEEAALIQGLIERDLPFYDASLTRPFIEHMKQFSRGAGVLAGDPPYEAIVATAFSDAWTR